MRALALGRGLFGILVGELVEAESAGFGDGRAAGDGVRITGEQARHFRRRLEMAFGVRRKAAPRLVHRAMFADAGQHVGERAPLGAVIERVVGGDQRRAGRGGEGGKGGEPLAVAPVEADARGEEDVGKAPRDTREAGGETPVGQPLDRRQHDQSLALCMGLHVAPCESALALGSAPPPDGQKARKPPVGGAVGGQAERARPVLEVEAGADDQGDAATARCGVGAHDAGQAVAVHDGNGAVAERGSGFHPVRGGATRLRER